LASTEFLVPANITSIAEVAGVTKRYRRNTALQNVSLTIPAGVTGLLGPNGSGKSTLIKSLLGLVKIQSGSGRVMDHQWPKMARAIRDSVGYLPEDDCYIAGLTGIESVAFMAELSGLPRVEGLRRSHEIMDFSDIGEERYREVEGYSTGMRQKLKFAQALVHDPPLLILDEPTTGLDPDQRHAMLSRIKTLWTDYGKSIILSTHILPDVRSVCDHVVILVGGTVRVADSLENLSRPVTPTVQVSVLGDPEPFLQQLRGAGFAADADDAGLVMVAGVEATSCQQLWAIAAESMTSIRSMTPAQNSLEQIFFDATASLSPEVTVAGS